MCAITKLDKTRELFCQLHALNCTHTSNLFMLLQHSSVMPCSAYSVIVQAHSLQVRRLGGEGDAEGEQNILWRGLTEINPSLKL